jgi:hypothetical protein
MSLYDRVTPSERAVDLALIVRQLRKHGPLAVIPILVVERPNDAALFGNLCVLGSRQVFAAGTRGLVEQLLIYLRANPIPTCAPVFLTDCDGRGKAPALKDERSLVVTEGCDVEADLVSLGVAERVVVEAVREQDAARSVLGDAGALALPLSLVRRAADAEGISMKRSGKRLSLFDLPGTLLTSWRESTPHAEEVVADVAPYVGWSLEDRRRIVRAVAGVSTEFTRSVSGKDVLEAAYAELRARGEEKFTSPTSFCREVERELGLRDLEGWVVAHRVRAWEQREGHSLLRCSEESL